MEIRFSWQKFCQSAVFYSTLVKPMMNPNVGEFVPIADKEDTKPTSVGLKRILIKTRQPHKQGELIRLPQRARKTEKEIR